MRCQDGTHTFFFIFLIIAAAGSLWETIRAMEAMGGEFFLRVSGHTALLITLYFIFDVLDRAGPDKQSLTSVKLIGDSRGRDVALSTVFSNLALPFAFWSILELVVVDYAYESQITELDDGDRILLLLGMPIVYLTISLISSYGRAEEPLVYWSFLPLGIYYLTALVYENWDNVGATKGIYGKDATDKFFWFRAGEVTAGDGQIGTFILALVVFFGGSAAIIVGWVKLVVPCVKKPTKTVRISGGKSYTGV